mmetsp:Transcript_34512/g.90300  ORF Transcript_34512/g.90300 Transcript_34512/m.90300 type:complete len:217 (-) Transcript_34512:1970-2620(-)
MHHLTSSRSAHLAHAACARCFVTCCSSRSRGVASKWRCSHRLRAAAVVLSDAALDAHSDAAFRPAPGGATAHCSGSFFSRHWWRAPPRIQPLRTAHTPSITSLLRRPSAPRASPFSCPMCVCTDSQRQLFPALPPPLVPPPITRTHSSTTSALSTLVDLLSPLPLCALLRAARSRATALLRYCAIALLRVFCQLTCLLCVSVDCLWQYRLSRGLLL